LRKYLINKSDAEQFYGETLEKIKDGSFPVDKLQVTQRIAINSKALLHLGSVGDKVTFWISEEKRFGKRNQPIKSLEKPTNTEPYWKDHYIKKLSKIHNELIAVILSTPF
jgi:hypothetical protein